MGVRETAIGALCLLVGAIAAAPAGAVETHTYSNSNSIAIDPFFAATAGPLHPYPSPIAVTDARGTITGTKVSLKLISYGDIDELDALLVGPGGQYAMVLSDVCDPGQNTTSNPLTFTFDDAAGSPVPQAPPCISGTFKPTNYGTTDGISAHPPAPAQPAGGYPSALSTFNGGSADGLWQLFVYDDASATTGSIAGGWTLELTTTGAPAAKKRCKNKHKRSASAAKKKRCKKKRRKKKRR